MFAEDMDDDKVGSFFETPCRMLLLLIVDVARRVMVIGRTLVTLSFSCRTATLTSRPTVRSRRLCY